MDKYTVILILVVILIFYITFKGTKMSKYKKLTPGESNNLINENKNNKDFMIIDIRTSNEYNSGHINDAVLMDCYAPDFNEKLDKLNKQNIYLVYCHGGNRSGSAMRIFEQSGFENVYDMKGGISGWQMAGLPVV